MRVVAVLLRHFKAGRERWVTHKSCQIKAQKNWANQVPFFMEKRAEQVALGFVWGRGDKWYNHYFFFWTTPTMVGCKFYAKGKIFAKNRGDSLTLEVRNWPNWGALSGVERPLVEMRAKNCWCFHCQMAAVVVQVQHSGNWLKCTCFSLLIWAQQLSKAFYSDPKKTFFCLLYIEYYTCRFPVYSIDMNINIWPYKNTSSPADKISGRFWRWIKNRRRQIR